MMRAALHVLAHNSAAELDACLTSLLAQNYPYTTVTVIDNGSTDHTLMRLAPWQARGVRVIAFARNHFYARAHNEAIAGSDADVIFTINPDALLAPDFVSRVMAVFARDERIGSVNGRLFLFQDELFDPALLSTAPPPDALLDSAGLMVYHSRRPWLRGYRQPAETTCTDPTLIFGADGACAAYRRAMLDDIALDTPAGPEWFDNDFVMYREDVDLAWRAQLLGWDSWYEPAARGYHVRSFHLGRDRGRMSAFLRRHSVKNGWALLLKHEEWGAIWRALSFILPYQAKILGGLLTIERSSLGAIADILRLLPRFRAKRAQIMARRRRTARDLAHWFV